MAVSEIKLPLCAVQDLPEAESQLVRFVLNRQGVKGLEGIWEFAWMFSPATNPDNVVREAAEKWRKLRNEWLNMLLEWVPDVRELAEISHRLTLLDGTVSKAAARYSDKPIRRPLYSALFTLGTILRKFGA